MSVTAAMATDLPPGLEELKHLMRSVHETTERLEHTHATLQGQVARLQRELAEANARLQRSRALAALGEMAAGIAHEVRNPLASIGLYAQMLAEDVADRPQAARLCGQIVRGVEGLDAVVRDVLRFARDTTLRPEPLQARALAERALAGCSCLPGDAPAPRRTFADGPDIRLEADGGLLVQALGNVIRNALEAMAESQSPRKELRLEVSRRRCRVPGGTQADRVVFAVSDTGPGIPGEVMERVFNPFFTTRATGTGLGLAIVHRIVDAHGGHVNVLNRPEGGATVELCLPLSPRAASGTPDSPIARRTRASAMKLGRRTRASAKKSDPCKEHGA